MAFTRQTLGHASALLLGVGFLLLIMVGGLSLYLAQCTRDYTDSMTRLQTARVALTYNFRELQDAESGQRGYLLTHNPVYLQPYQDAMMALPAGQQSLRRQLAMFPAASSVSDDLLAAMQSKVAELRQTLALGGVPNDLGEQLMNRVRADVDRLLDMFDEQRQAERALLLSRNTMLLAVSWSGLGLILLLACAAGVVVTRAMGEAEQAQKEIEAANATLELRVRDRTADLEAANEEVQRFAYIVSHDLRAPLLNIMGFTAELQSAVLTVGETLKTVGDAAPGLLREDARRAVEEDFPESIAFIRTSAQRMDRLINAILKLSREGRRVLTPETINTGELFRSLAATLKHQMDEAAAELTVASPLPSLVSDRLALEQIFGNIIDNAIKYLLPGRPGRIAVHGKVSGAQVRFDIEDNGRGIDPKDRERVFELFRRAGPQDRPGEGIGLAHVKALVRRLGGTIDFTSQPGQGAIFSVLLPRTLKV